MLSTLQCVDPAASRPNDTLVCFMSMGSIVEMDSRAIFRMELLSEIMDLHVIITLGMSVTLTHAMFIGVLFECRQSDEMCMLDMHCYQLSLLYSVWIRFSVSNALHVVMNTI